MASILDLGFINYFSIIFVFLFVFFVSYAILKFTKVFKDNEGINAILALSMAALFVVYEPARQIIVLSSPWFVLLFVFIFFILIAVSFLGIGGGDVGSALSKAKNTRIVVYWIITIGVIIMLYSFSQVIGQSVGPYLDGESANKTISPSETADEIRGDSGVGTGDFQTNLGATLFHPKVLGTIVVLLIASFAIRMLAGKTE